MDPAAPPVTVDEFKDAEIQLAEDADLPGEIFRKKSEVIESRTKRLARDRAFRLKVLEEYSFCCALTRRTFANPSGSFGLDAAHIVPVNRLGSDHPINGILLSKGIHWAFDQGLWGVKADRTVIVPSAVEKIPGNEFLADLAGVSICEAKTEKLRASSEAFNWHRENILIKS